MTKGNKSKKKKLDRIADKHVQVTTASGGLVNVYPRSRLRFGGTVGDEVRLLSP